MSEILFLGILALVVIGPKELPQLARTLGRFLNELKRSSSVLTDELKQQVRFDLDEKHPAPRQEPSTQHSPHEGEHTSGSATQESMQMPAQDPQQLELLAQEPPSANTKDDEHKKS